MVKAGPEWLDDAQELRFNSTSLRGDRWVDENAALPVRTLDPVPGPVAAVDEPAEEFSLDGDWLVRPSAPTIPITESQLGDWEHLITRGSASEGLRAGWYKPDTDRSAWATLAVPGTVQSSMFERGQLEDPFWETNTYDELVEHGTPPEVPWNLRKTRIEQSEWWYATTFTLPASMRDRHLTLHFDGIDYAGTVYLNGQSFGHSVGMFGGPDFDVSQLVDPTAPNTLVVRVLPPPPHWFGSLKGSPGWGWHYGHLVSVGLWKSVRLRATPPVEPQHPFVMTRSCGDDVAELDLSFDLSSSLRDPTELRAGIVITAPDGSETTSVAPITALPGTSRWTAPLRIAAPQRWWPQGWGDQPLYQARVLLTTPDGAPVGPAAETVFGIRTVEMAPANRPQSPTTYRWQFVINGIPMFVKGLNWCWNDPMNGPSASRIPFLQQAVDAGVQMLRAWGGGIIESPEFYDFCDRHGILVYQEFPFSWGPPDAPQTDLGVVDDQVRRVVLARRSHPSLIMWGGGNENAAAVDADEGLTLVGKRCRQFDPSRPFHRTSPWGGSAHNYDVYHAGAPIDSGYRSIDAVFYGEFGLPSMPNRRSSERMLSKAALDSWPPTADDHAVIAHMHQFRLFDFVKELRYCHYGPVESWDDYIEFSQLAQGDAMRYAAERQRAGAVDGSKTGFWFYKLTELFPGHSWGVLDFWGARKDSYYRVKQVLRPRTLFATYDSFDCPAGGTFSAQLFAANDSRDPWTVGEAIAELYDQNLELIAEQRIPSPTVKSTTTISLGAFTVQLPSGSTPSLLALRSATGEPDFDSWYWFNFLQKTDEMREIEARPFRHPPLPTDSESEALIRPYTQQVAAPLRQLPKTELKLEREGAQIRITNIGTVPSFNVTVRGLDQDVEVDDSSFSLAPRQSKTVTVTTAGTPTVAVASWNARTISVGEDS